jgi:hypothetical protein
MPRWELVTTWCLRGALLATAIIYIVRQDWAIGIFCVVALAIAVTPTIAARSASFAWPVEVEILLLWLATAHITLGELFDLYTDVGWFDKALHFSDSLLIGFTAFLAVYVAHYMRREKPHPWLDGVAILLITLGLGAFWEIIEFIEDHYFGMHTQGSPTMAPLPDTMWDLISDGAGGVIAAILGPVFMHHSRRSRKRAADFAQRAEGVSQRRAARHRAATRRHRRARSGPSSTRAPRRPPSRRTRQGRSPAAPRRAMDAVLDRCRPSRRAS